eukprot:scaffold148894_cov45-Tisochrysis_lutea.AAC.1
MVIFLLIALLIGLAVVTVVLITTAWYKFYLQDPPVPRPLGSHIFTRHMHAVVKPPQAPYLLTSIISPVRSDGYLSPTRRHVNCAAC